MNISVLGIDLGKNVCSVVGLDASGAVVMRRRMRRDTLIGLAEKLPACVVGMETCCGSHHVGRVFASHGHDVRLMSPEYVRPYVKAQKNDNRDAEGIAEATTRPTMRFVELKSQDQLDMQTLHRSRDRLVGERIALINQLRAILRQQVSAQTIDPRGARRAASASRSVTRRLARWAKELDEEGPSQCRGRRLGEQVGDQTCAAA